MSLKSSSALACYTLLLILVLTLVTSQLSISNAAHQPRVLLISSYHPAFPTFFEQINGVKSVLDAHEVELDIEFMDSKRFFSDASLNNFYNSLKHKLSQVPPYDVIMVADDNALNFAIDHQQELFGQTPIVFFGVNNIALALQQNNAPQITGVIERVSMRDTIALMLSLRPYPTTIYAIVDDTPSGQGDIETFRMVTQEYTGISFRELSLTEYSFTELGTKLSEIEGSSAVLLLSAYHDRDGASLDFADSLQLIRARLTVPLYHLWYHGMGDGILGGKVISHFEQGSTAAEMVMQILSGTPVASIPVRADSPNRYIFDYNEMVRFNIMVSELPQDSLYVNRPVSLYQTYKTAIWLVLVVIMILLALIVLLSFNILKRHQIEKQLRASEQKYRTYIDSAPYGVFVTNQAGQTVEVNSTATRITGYSKDRLLTLPIDALMASSPKNNHQVLPPIPDNQAISVELKLARPNGDEYIAAIDAVKLPDNQILAYCNDITDRKQAELELRQRNRQLNVINRVIATSTVEVATSALLTAICRELAHAFDVPQSAAALYEKGKTVARVVAEYRADDRPSGINHLIPLTNNPTVDYLVKHKKPLIISNAKTDIRLLPVEQFVQERQIASILLMPLIIDGEVVGSLGVDSLEPDYFSQTDLELASSVSNQVSSALTRAKLTEEQQKLEERYHHAQRMEALGRLTGGVAHDFNNLLTAINGFTEMVQAQLSPDHQAQPMLANILNSGVRAAELVRQLLAFSRKQIIEPKTLDLNVIITDLGKMLRRIIGENIHLNTSLKPNIWPVKMDPTQIEQVILNLVVNSRDAMPEGGTLSIQTFNYTLTDNYWTTAAQPELTPGDYVALVIRDTGVGIEPEIQSQIFEPFFTTKGLGKGTGLGLATVYGIVKQNGGDILVKSVPQKGTHFVIYFPKDTTGIFQTKKTNSNDKAPVGHETILVVEDDPLVRAFIGRVLRLQGYNLIEADNAETALRIARQNSENIDLLLTDVIMPGINGKLLSEKFAVLRPDTTVLFTSGYTDDYILRHGVLETGFHFIQKPLTPVELAKKVREVLDSAKQKAAIERLENVE